MVIQLTNINLWQVDLKSCTSKNTNDHDCPLSELADLEIRVGGGIKHASFAGQYETLFDMEDKHDTDTTKALHFCFSAGSGGLWLNCIVHNWPREQWTALLRGQEPEDGLQYLVETLAEQDPQNKTVSFSEVAFFGGETNAFLERLGIEHNKMDYEDEQWDEILIMVFNQYDELAAVNANANANNSGNGLHREIINPFQRQERRNYCIDVQRGLVEIFGLGRCVNSLHTQEDSEAHRGLLSAARILLRERDRSNNSEDFSARVALLTADDNFDNDGPQQQQQQENHQRDE